MKLSYLSGSIACLSIFFFSQSVLAQITIVQGDLMNVGTVNVMYFDTTGPALNFGGSGAGQTWDFTNVTISLQYNQDILDPGTQVKSALFPTATAAIDGFGVNVQYYEDNATELRHLATVVLFLDTPVYQKNYAYLKYPASLGSSHSETGTKGLTSITPLGFDPDASGPHPFVDSMATMTMEVFESDINAEGKVKTPEGEYDALRQYNVITSIDSAYMYANGAWVPMSTTLSTMLMKPLVLTETTYAYAWIVKGKSLPVMNIEFDPNNNDEVLTAQWMKDDYVGVNEKEDELSMHIYPNPASDVINIEHNLKKASFNLFDQNAKVIKQGDLSDNHCQISIAGLSQGTYYIRVKNDSGLLVKDQKILISK